MWPYINYALGLLGLAAAPLVVIRFWRWYSQHHGPFDEKLARDILLEPVKYSVARSAAAWLYLDDQFAARVRYFDEQMPQLLLDHAAGSERPRLLVRELSDGAFNALKDPYPRHRNLAFLALAKWHFALDEPVVAEGYLSRVAAPVVTANPVS